MNSCLNLSLLKPCDSTIPEATMPRTPCTQDDTLDGSLCSWTILQRVSQIFNILVLKHIYIPRPFFSFSDQPHSMCPCGQKRVLKLVQNCIFTFLHIFQLIFFTGHLLTWRGLSLKSQVCWVMAKKVLSSNFFTLEAAGGLNQPPRSFSYIFPSKGCLELSELVWHLAFCCKLLSLEPSNATLKNWIQPRWMEWNGPLKGFLNPLNGPNGRP